MKTGKLYVVNCEMEGGSGPLVLVKKSTFWKSIPQGGVLLDDSREATVFGTRREARAAITRTMDYWHNVHNRHHDWPDDAYSVRRLVPAGDGLTRRARRPGPRTPARRKRASTRR